MKALEKLLADLEAVANAATPGPWRWHNVDSSFEVLVGPLENPLYPTIDTNTVMDDGSSGGEYGSCIDSTTPDGQFIAASRTAVPQLIKALRKAIEQRDRYLSELMNQMLSMDPRTKHCAPKDNEQLETILRGETK